MSGINKQVWRELDRVRSQWVEVWFKNRGPGSEHQAGFELRWGEEEKEFLVDTVNLALGLPPALERTIDFLLDEFDFGRLVESELYGALAPAAEENMLAYLKWKYEEDDDEEE